MKSSKYIAKFKLPPQEVLIDDWSCALSKAILLQGRLYMSQGYLCFYSNVFGKNIREAIRFEDIATIRKRNKFAIGIEVHLKNGIGKYFFCSFIARSKTYKKILDAWHKRCGVPPFAADEEDSQANEPSEGSKRSPPTTTAAAAAAAAAAANEGNSSTSQSSEDDNDNNSSDSSDNSNMYKLFTPAAAMSSAFLDPAQKRVEVLPPTEVQLTPAQYFYVLLSDYGHDFEMGLKYLTPRKDVTIAKWKASPEHEGAITREIRYVMSLVELKAPIGPPETRVIEENRYTLTEDKCVYQIKSTSLDIPYGDCFHIEAEWTITLAPSGSSSFVSATACLAWCRRCLMKSIVEATTLKQIRTQYSDYIKQAIAYANDKKEVLSKITFKKPGKSEGSDSKGSSKKTRHHHHSHKTKSQQAQSLELAAAAAAASGGGGGSSNGSILKIDGGQWNYMGNALFVIFALVLVFLSVKVSRIEKLVSTKLDL